MADQVKAIEKFRHWGEEAAIEATKPGGLAPKFHACVYDLCKEMAGQDVDDVLLAFDAAIEEVEAAAKGKLEETFGKGATLSKALPSFKVMKSTYRSFVKYTGGVMDAEKFGNWYSVREEVSRRTKAKKEAMKGGASGGTNLKGLSPTAVSFLSEGLDSLRELPAHRQEAVAKGFRNRAFAEQRNGNPKTAANAAGGSAKTEDAA